MNSHTSENKVKIWRRVMLLLAAVVTALAVAVTCALTIDTSKTVSVDNADGGEVYTSATYTNATGDYSAPAKLRNGDIFNFTTATSFTLTLPKGEYKIEAYGAAGGKGYTSVYGGYGGFSSGTLKLTDAQTVVYVYVGGVGGNYTSRTAVGGSGGGFNGGGNTRGSSSTGGGGASDIRIGTNALNYRVLVAGGGGGGGYSNTNNRYKGVGGGASGGNNGNTGITNYAYGYGATQTAGGSYLTTAKYTNHTTYGYPTAGTFGKGGQGVGRAAGGGGGGGGWYGGGGGCYAGGGGGSGFVLTTSITSASAELPTDYFGSKTNTAAYYKYRMTSASTTTSTHTGNGSVKITVVNCNLEPTSQNYNIPTVSARGTGLAISVAASTLAKDTDYANITNGNINNVYFTAGNSSNYDTAPTANNGLYLDAACTKNANTYLNYDWTGNTALNIRGILKLPRANVDGQADNKFTLYTKMRDAFGTTTTRGVGVVKLTMSVTNNPITVNGAKNKVNYYKFGPSTHNAEADRILNYNEIVNNNYVDNNIYNPQGKGITTLFIPKPISPSDTTGYTISASELFSDADTNYDKVAFKSITVLSAYSAYSQYYSLNLNSDSAYATGLFPSFTLKPSGVRPTGSPWVVMQITAQSSETSSKAAVGNTVNTVYLVFRISNTRPYLGSTNVLPEKFAEPSVTLAPGEVKSLKLNDLLKDLDDGSNIKATFAQELKVPTNEFIQVDSTNTAVALDPTVGSNYYGRTTVADNSVTTGEGTTPTHFNKSLIVAQGSNGESTANVTYRYVDSQTIEFTGRAATQNQYRTADGKADPDRTGHFYVLIRLIDPSDPGDNGIWFPIAIEVTSGAPTEPATFANATLGFKNYNAGSDTSTPYNGDGDEIYFTPISYVDANGELKGIGSRTKESGAQQATPFALDADGFIYSGRTYEHANAINDFVFIDGGVDAILDNTAETTGTFFKVEPYELFAAKTVFEMIPEEDLAGFGVTPATGDGSDTYYKFTGLKVTALRSTNGEYYQFRVKVKDTHGKPGAGEDGTVSICIKVDNRPVAQRLDAKKDDAYRINALLNRNGVTPYGSYEVNANLGTEKRVNYTIEVFDEVQITPYDFAYDFDNDPNVDKVNPVGTLNSNPLDAGFAGFSDYVLKTYNIAHTENPATSQAQKTKSAVGHQKLDFINRANITAYGEQYSNYIGVKVNDTSVVKTENEDGTVNSTTYDIPSITITGVSRTTSAIIQLSFTISDGFTSVQCNVTVSVINSAPMLNTARNHPVSGMDKERLESYYSMSAYTDTTDDIVPNVRTFTAKQLAYDKDGDNPTFDAASIKVVAKDGDNYYSQLYYDKEDRLYHSDYKADRTTINLADYISASIAKGTGGADVLRLQGLSSTELINLPIYVEFTMGDGYRAQPKYSTLHLLINVVNSKPIFVSDGLLEDSETDKRTWQIDYEVSSELKQKRYIFNCKELFDSTIYAQNGATPLAIASTNKQYLFDDYDARQRVILNPQQFYSSDRLVATYDNRTLVNGQIDDTKTKIINAETFIANPNAAVLYTPMYESKGTSTDLLRGYLTVKVLFFEKTADGFRQLPASADIRECEYWAIEIQDEHDDGTRREVQFAFAVKDSHHGEYLYETPEKTQKKEEANDSAINVLNFYYNYSKPGILAMHTYYRTDGNTESKIAVGDNAIGETQTNRLVDYTAVSSDMFDKSAVSTAIIDEYNNVNTTADRKQEILATVKFADDFQYRYFERTYETTEGGSAVTKLTYKHFSDKSFTYAPIKIAPSTTNSSVIVPMSYIALPKGVGNDTENGTHVTFANAGNTKSGSNKLLDSEYTKWLDSNDSLALVYSNITVSDGTKKYSVQDNPYINIKYVASTATKKVTFGASYINTERFKVNADNSKTNIGTTTYREDKYGFEFSKKNNGPRATGTLKLTFALKTIDSKSEGQVEMVDVDINLLDFNPTTIAYYNPITNSVYNESNRTYFVETSVSMTVGNTSDSTMSLVNERLDAYKAGPDNGSKGKIYYYDPDLTDTMKFYMPSAFTTKVTVGEDPTPTPVTFTVTFDPGEGSLVAGSPSELKTDENGKLTASELPLAGRDNYGFKGWSLTPNPDENATLITLDNTYTEDTTVYAVYKANDTTGGDDPPAPTTYKVTFDVGDGALKADEPTELYTNASGMLTADSLPKAEKTNYEFLGWSTTPNPDENAALITLNDTYSKDTTVFAVYKANGGEGGDEPGGETGGEGGDEPGGETGGGETGGGGTGGEGGDEPGGETGGGETGGEGGDEGGEGTYALRRNAASREAETTIRSMLTDSEIEYILSSKGDSSPRIPQYYGVASADNIGVGEGLVNPYTYDPNPGYETFFSVSPSAGSSDTIQFIPKAKTQLAANVSAAVKQAYYQQHHLLEDEKGNAYYPFRILFYDECRGSAFTKGYWYTAIIRVYINNDPIKVNTDLIGNETYRTSNQNVSAEFRGKDVPNYKLSISGNTKFYVDVSSLLSDEDIVLTDAGSLATEKDNAWISLPDEEKYIKDCLVMPVKEGGIVEYIDLSKQEYPNMSDKLPFTVNVGGEGGNLSLPHTTLVFEASCAFKSARNLGFKFSDSNGSTVYIVFTVEYNNDAPTPNKSTFGGANTIDVTLKTKEKFYLYATDFTQFENDKDGGFTSYSTLKNSYSKNGLPTASAESMANNFKYFTSTYGTSAAGDGDSLVLASDDAATTLRIISVVVADDSNRTIESIKNLLTVEQELVENREDINSKGYLRVSVEAKGAITTTLAITLVDAKGATTVVNVKVNVMSTAPTAKTKDLPEGLSLVKEEGVNNTYEMSLKYGESKAISLRSIMDDIDCDDTKTLDVYTNMSGDKFSITNPGDSAVISAVVSKEGSSYNHVKITATDFITQTGENAYATVKFRVTDIHDAVSDTISVRVKIAPEPVTSVVAANKALAVGIMSYADFIDTDKNAGEPQELKIVDGDKATLFKDPAVEAASSAYNVDVYVLLKKNEDSGAFNTVAFDSQNIGNNILLYSRDASREQYGSGDEVNYVQNYFGISASEGGKTLLFTPNAATSSIIPLYVRVGKRDSNGASTSTVGARIEVTVANSRLVATESSSLNMGYPLVSGSQDLRDANFLTFTGSKGDSLTWKLYDLENTERGLYYDYDMLNLSSAKGGKEYIKYIDYSYTVPNESANNDFGPVLKVSLSGEGANQAVTITINRNITAGQPDSGGLKNEPTAIDVYIYAVDAANDTTATKNDKDKVTATKITVNVTNDRPEIDVTGIVTRCPYCGKTDTVRQTTARAAQCSSCNKSFKSLDPDQLGYSLSHDDEAGYVMNMTLENGKSCNVNIADIIDDADIDMDVYVMLNTGADGSLMGRDGNSVSYVRANEENAFSVAYQTGTNSFKVSTLSYITFTCRSVARGAVGVCNVKFRDSYIGSETSVLTIRLTVGNTEPTLKSGAKTAFTMMGVGKAVDDEAVTAAGKVYSILDFISDANGDNFDPTDAKNANRTPTYTYIDEIVVYTSSDDTAVNRPEIYGPNLKGTVVDEDTGESEIANTVDTVCSITWLDDDTTHQKFRIEPFKGIYGVQKFLLRIYDSGYEDGLAAGIMDGKRYDLVLTVTVADPLDDIPTVLPARDMVYGVTRTILVKDLLDESAPGYTIASIEELDGTHNLRILPPDEEGDDNAVGEWRIYAYTESVSAKVKITFITGDGITRERTMPITIVANNKPQYKNGISSYRYTVSMLDDKEQRTIKIKPTDWFEDNDLEDIMKFITPITSSQTVKVEAHRVAGSESDESETYILLKFNRRGESVITVTLTDLSGRSYTYTVTVECTDAPELSWWEDFVSLIEANWMWFWIAVGGFCLLLILIIVIIVVVHKKRKMRREIEALLESETELEQEMLRLSSGAAAYQSFGYLPPTPQSTMNPGMMLGGGAAAPQPNNLQLNAGTGPTVNNIPGSAPNARPTQQPQGQRPRSNDGFDPNDF